MQYKAQFLKGTIAAREVILTIVNLFTSPFFARIGIKGREERGEWKEEMRKYDILVFFWGEGRGKEGREYEPEEITEEVREIREEIFKLRALFTSDFLFFNSSEGQTGSMRKGGEGE